MLVLENLWSQAFNEGVQLAESLTGPVSLDPMAKRDLIDEFGSQWVREIAKTRTDQIAAILAAGGTEASLTAAIEAVMNDPAAAELIARTEIARAFSAGASAVYAAAHVPEVLWLTSGDSRVCPHCAANEAAGPVSLGKPFPGGAIAPPQHPRCRCILIPA